MSKKVKVKIDKHIFTSLADACKYLKVNCPAGLYYALKQGNKTYNGHTIERLNKKKENKLSCPVICVNLNKKFKTITEASHFAKVDNWTMSKKMATAGQFKDKEGNIYERLKPMKTKNNYKNTGDVLKREVKSHNRIVNKDSTLKVLEEPKLTTSKQFNAKSFLQEKIINCIKEDNISEAKAYIQVIESLK